MGMMTATPGGILKRFGWANFSLFPLVIATGAVCTMAVSFSMYSLFKKTDVTISDQAHPRWERVNPSQNQKLLRLNQEYKPIPALETLKREMGER